MRLILSLLTVAVLAAACVQTGGPRRPPDGDVRTGSDPSDAEKRASVRLELAGGYFSRGQFNTALDEIKLALAAKPDMGAAYNMRGLVYAAMGEERLADGGAELGQVGVDAVAERLEEHLAGERVAVRVQTDGRQPDQQKRTQHGQG